MAVIFSSDSRPWKWDLACKKRICGGTSADVDENGQMKRKKRVEESGREATIK